MAFGFAFREVFIGDPYSEGKFIIQDLLILLSVSRTPYCYNTHVPKISPALFLPRGRLHDPRQIGCLPHHPFRACLIQVPATPCDAHRPDIRVGGCHNVSDPGSWRSDDHASSACEFRQEGVLRSPNERLLHPVLTLHSDCFSRTDIAAYIVWLVHGLAPRIWLPRVRASCVVYLLILKNMIGVNYSPRYGVIPLALVGRTGASCFGRLP